MSRTALFTGTLPQIEAALARAIGEARAPDPLAPVTVLVGHVLLKSYLRRALAAAGVPQLNVRFVRPHELAASMAADGRAADWAALSPGAERLLAREIADGAGGYFGAVAGREGFAEALQRLFREIEMGGFNPVSLARALGDAAADETSKFGQIVQLYAAFLRRRAQAKLAAPADHYAAAMSAALEGPLFIYGLWAPSEAQLRLIEHIAGHADVTAFLPASGLDAADEAHLALRDRLALGATVTRLERESESATAPRNGQIALGLDRAAADVAAETPLAAALFRPGVRAEKRNVELISAPDTVREVWEAARACLAWAREGIRFHEMAVVYRHREPYRALVDEIFSEAEIETYLHDGRLLSAHPKGRRLLALLELMASHDVFPRAGVMEFLTETEIARETAQAYGRVRPSEWEGYTREAGVVEGHAQWQGRLRLLAEKKRDESRTEGREWAAGVADRIDTLCGFISDFHTALADHPAEATWDEHLDYLGGLASRYAVGTEPIVDVLRDLKTLGAVRERVPFEIFCRAVRDDLESRDASRVLGEPVRMFGRRGVAVIDASSLRHMRFRAVYLLGVAERSWPPPPRPDPLLLEGERRRINDAGAGVLPLRTEPDAHELEFWLAVQSPLEHLTISYSRAEAGRSGKHLPSYFFRSVIDAFEGRRLSLEELEWSPHVRRVEAGRLTCYPIEHALSPAEYDRGLVRAANDARVPAAIAALSRDAARPGFGRAVAARRERWGAALTAHDGVMTSEAAARAAAEASVFLNPDRSVSPSRLETYAACPYRYFLRYALYIDPLEEPERIDRMDHLQRGTLIHEILQTFFLRTGRADPPSRARRAEHLALLDEISRSCGDERVKRGVTGRPLIWALDKQAIDEDLVRWYDEEVRYVENGDLLPGAFEARFGPAFYGNEAEDAQLSTDEPLALTADGRALRVQGRIDRIDWDDARTHFRVIDYKTGKKRAKAGLDKGRALQLPIYLHAAASMLGMPPERGASEYFYVSSRGEFGRVGIDGAAAASPAFEQVLRTIADGVDAGTFLPNPGRARDNCLYCDYKDVCDQGIVKIMDRKSGDARGQAFFALEEIE